MVGNRKQQQKNTTIKDLNPSYPFYKTKNIHVIRRTHHLTKEVDRLGFLSFK